MVVATSKQIDVDYSNSLQKCLFPYVGAGTFSFIGWVVVAVGRTFGWLPETGQGGILARRCFFVLSVSG